MTILELSINIIIIFLLLPAIFYAAKLSNQLSKQDKQQKQMSELAQALIYAVNKLDTPAVQTEQTQTQPSVSDSVSDEDQNEIKDSNAESMPQDNPNPVVREAASIQEETLSEAEKELLMALRSIK